MDRLEKAIEAFRAVEPHAIINRAALLAAIDAERERCAKRLTNEIQGGHCGEGGMEVIARQRRNAWLTEAASIVRAAL